MLGFDRCGKPRIVGAHRRFDGPAAQGEPVLEPGQRNLLPVVETEFVVKQSYRSTPGDGCSVSSPRPTHTRATVAAKAIAETSRFRPPRVTGRPQAVATAQAVARRW